MKTVIIGSNGQLGSDLQQVFNGESLTGLLHNDIEISDEKSVNDIILSLKPDFLINTAAFHRTELCEREPQQSYAVNTIAPLYLARACETIGATFIHISTDYVFDGAKKKPYVETDKVSPLNVYGNSKAAGEWNVINNCEKHYVIRTSGLYGAVPCRAKGDNFVTKMLKLARERGKISVVTDEILTPTWTYSLAKQIYEICKSDHVPYGIIHATDEGECSWYEFAKEIFELSGVRVELNEAKVTDFPMTVKRPTYSVLENQILKEVSLNKMIHWTVSLKKYLHLILR